MPIPHRTERLADTLLKEAASLILFEAQDERIKRITLTRATLTKDLRLLRLYYSAGDDQIREEIEEGLKESRGFIRRGLAQRVKLRYVPEVEFFFDETDELRRKAEELFERIK
ncbi:MAG: 30S ribosome-binding factor RbfA [Deltaproteobacteria bacterium]|nr:30S ribosome-binding factor RbfA [Deltaproteobacteria bacterium]